MGLSFRLLGSGSSGNATLVSDGETHILVDVGLSGRETARRLRECGLSAGDIAAIVISHEHGDHCRGVAPFSKELNTPVFMTDAALKASGMPLAPERHQSIRAGAPFDVYGFLFTPFAVPHDAADPLGFCIEKAGVRIGIALDLGFVSNLVVERLRGCDGIVLESNHDLNMLQVGPYPWALKQRVKSNLGHLSNDAVACFLAGEFDGRASHVILAHLSRTNNLPELALLSARRALEGRSGFHSSRTRLELAAHDEVSRPYVY